MSIIVPIWSLRRTLTCFSWWMVSLTYRTYIYAFTYSKIIYLPWRTITSNIDTFLQISIPSSSICTIRYDACSIDWIEKRRVRETLTWVVWWIVGMIDRTHVLTGLKGKIEILPYLAFQYCRSTFLEIEVPFQSFSARQSCTIFKGRIVERIRWRTWATIILRIIGMIEGTHIDTTLIGKVIYLPRWTITFDRTTFHQIHIIFISFRTCRYYTGHIGWIE